MTSNKERFSDSKILEIAHNIVRGNYINFSGEQSFYDVSSIYRFTNEDITSFFHHFERKNKVLTAIGSGAPILNGILGKSFNFDAFDISVFPEYYLFLQLTSFVSLSKEEYFGYYLSNDREELFNEYFYEKISNNLKGKYKLLWDSLYMFNEGIDIYESLLFRQDFYSKNTAIENNPYLQEDNYYKVRDILQKESIKITPFVTDITKTRFTDEYDLINLSNILVYYFKPDELGKYVSFLRQNFSLTETGEIINYFYGMNSSVEEELTELLKPNGYVENIKGKKLLVYKK